LIRRLTEKDHKACFHLLKKKSAENLFIIGDIEVYGYSQEFQKVWGEFNQNGELIAVLLKYEENYIPFALGKFDARGFADIMLQDPTFKMMSGLKDITEKIEPFLKVEPKKKRQTYYAKCTKLQVKNDDRSDSVQKATIGDVYELVDMLNSVPEFSDSVITVDKKRRGIQDGTSRSFFIKEKEKIVATASTAAENTVSAMVVGVATLDNYKKKGYATMCMITLCTELLAEGKELCLFYDNPAAGNIYKRIGFEDIGFWMMYNY